jgi:succinate dehydrogenase/fumarate reductase flavoprotein subunit
MRVLHHSSSVTDPVAVPGLYAVGQDSHGVLYSRQNPYAAYGAVAMGWSFVSGRRAGIEAAQLSQAMKAQR